MASNQLADNQTSKTASDAEHSSYQTASLELGQRHICDEDFEATNKQHRVAPSSPYTSHYPLISRAVAFLVRLLLSGLLRA
jgi:hypothetical protein